MQLAHKLLPEPGHAQRSDEARTRPGPGTVAFAALPTGSPDVGIGDTVSIHMLGGFDVVVDGAVRPAPSIRATTLLKLVSLYGALPLEVLTEHLWPDDPLPTGKVRLRNVLLRLRRLYGPLVVRDGETLRLVEDVEVDVARFEADARVALSTPSGDHAGLALGQRALTNYRGELLPADRYEEWTAGPRRRLRSRYLGLLDMLAADAEWRGDTDQAVRLLELTVDEEPLNEDRYLRMARLLLAGGRRGTALGWLDRAAIVTGELNLPPSAQYRDLLEVARGA